MISQSKLMDRSVIIRKGEEIDRDALSKYLNDKVGISTPLIIEQFPSGFSNLTYFVKLNGEEYVLRRPPFGANIKSAHDMKREFKVLQAVYPIFPFVPEPIIYCEDESVIGADFFIMRRIQGIILRSVPPRNMSLTPDLMNNLSRNCLDKMIALHSLDIEASGLKQLGKPEGYAKRQVEGWIKRYEKSKTDQLPGMEALAGWLASHIPEDNPPCMIHNDYKYDNMVLSLKQHDEIIAILDWEMATVGDPMMDLGTTLAYWTEINDPHALKLFNLTWMPGNLNRREVLDYYKEKTGSETKNIIFYYTYACFKLGVICQQIYARYKKGLTNDVRFAGLIGVVTACANNGQKALETDKISNF